LHKPNNKLIMCTWSIFGARTSHEQTRIHKTHHGPNLEETTIFSLIIVFMFGHGANIQMSFCFGTPAILESHNFVCRLSIKVKSKAKLYPLSKTFQWYVARHLHAKKSGRFLTFCGHESNWQFNSRPFLWP
jgi:hypothetical protein